MKTQNKTLFTRLDKTHLATLTKEVKETVAIPVNPAVSKNILSAAEVWKIQRMKRVRAQRRFLV